MILHKCKVTIVSSGTGDCVYVVFVHDEGYVRTKSAWNRKPINMSNTTDYYNTLIDMARKVV